MLLAACNIWNMRHCTNYSFSIRTQIQFSVMNNEHSYEKLKKLTIALFSNAGKIFLCIV